MDDLISRRLRRYPTGAIVMAISTYLAGLLGAVLDESQCKIDDVRELLREIEAEVLGDQSLADK